MPREPSGLRKTTDAAIPPSSRCDPHTLLIRPHCPRCHWHGKTSRQQTETELRVQLTARLRLEGGSYFQSRCAVPLKGGPYFQLRQRGTVPLEGGPYFQMRLSGTVTIQRVVLIRGVVPILYLPRYIDNLVVTKNSWTHTIWLFTLHMLNMYHEPIYRDLGAYSGWLDWKAKWLPSYCEMPYRHPRYFQQWHT